MPSSAGMELRVQINIWQNAKVLYDIILFVERNTMSVGTMAFLILLLFVIHEFEEIIRVLPWIKKNESNPCLSKDTWIARKGSYPSTESIATMIIEEIVFIGLVLFVGITLNTVEVIIAIAIINSIHLIGHIISGIKVHSWNPGSVTSTITLPVNVMIIVFAMLNNGKPILLAEMTIILGVVFVVNLIVLHKLADWINKIVNH